MKTVITIDDDGDIVVTHSGVKNQRVFEELVEASTTLVNWCYGPQGWRGDVNIIKGNALVQCVYALRKALEELAKEEV